MERYQVIAIAAIIPALVNWLLHRLSKEPEGKEGNEKTCRMWKKRSAQLLTVYSETL